MCENVTPTTIMRGGSRARATQLYRVDDQESPKNGLDFPKSTFFGDIAEMPSRGAYHLTMLPTKTHF
jgi:hypothetical protein